MIVAITVVTTVVFFGILHYLFPFIQVCGDSMFPTYNNGEILIGRRLFLKKNIKKGDVVVYKSPNGTVVIKRVEEITKYGLFCVGDNFEQSYDSRHYGIIPYSNLICRVTTRERRKL